MVKRLGGVIFIRSIKGIYIPSENSCQLLRQYFVAFLTEMLLSTPRVNACIAARRESEYDE